MPHATGGVDANYGDLRDMLRIYDSISSDFRGHFQSTS